MGQSNLLLIGYWLAMILIGVKFHIFLGAFPFLFPAPAIFTDLFTFFQSILINKNGSGKSADQESFRISQARLSADFLIKDPFTRF